MEKLFSMEKSRDLEILMKLAKNDQERSYVEYRKKYGATPVAYGTKGLWHPCTGMLYCIGGVHTEGSPVGICITSETFWFDFLNTFGHLVEELYIVSTYLRDFVFEDCTALKRLHLIENQNADGYNEELPRINERCQTLEYLEADAMNFNKRLTLHECFPNLREMTLQTFIDEKRSPFSLSYSSKLEASLPELERLQSLQLKFCDYGNDEMLKLVQTIPNLKHLQLNIIMKMWPGDGINRFLKECERLTSLKLSVRCSTQESVWRSSIASCWNITNNGDTFTIEKTD